MSLGKNVLKLSFVGLLTTFPWRYRINYFEVEVYLNFFVFGSFLILTFFLSNNNWNFQITRKTKKLISKYNHNFVCHSNHWVVTLQIWTKTDSSCVFCSPVFHQLMAGWGERLDCHGWVSYPLIVSSQFPILTREPGGTTPCTCATLTLLLLCTSSISVVFLYIRYGENNMLWRISFVL